MWHGADAAMDILTMFVYSHTLAGPSFDVRAPNVHRTFEWILHSVRLGTFVEFVDIQWSNENSS